MMSTSNSSSTTLLIITSGPDRGADYSVGVLHLPGDRAHRGQPQVGVRLLHRLHALRGIALRAFRQVQAQASIHR